MHPHVRLRRDRRIAHRVVRGLDRGIHLREVGQLRRFAADLPSRKAGEDVTHDQVGVQVPLAR
eukprot:7258124-Prymnesium_polylepis.1